MMSGPIAHAQEELDSSGTKVMMSGPIARYFCKLEKKRNKQKKIRDGQFKEFFTLAYVTVFARPVDYLSDDSRHTWSLFGANINRNHHLDS